MPSINTQQTSYFVPFAVGRVHAVGAHGTSSRHPLAPRDVQGLYAQSPDAAHESRLDNGDLAEAAMQQYEQLFTGSHAGWPAAISSRLGALVDLALHASQKGGRDWQQLHDRWRCVNERIDFGRQIANMQSADSGSTAPSAAEKESLRASVAVLEAERARLADHIARNVHESQRAGRSPWDDEYAAKFGRFAAAIDEAAGCFMTRIAGMFQIWSADRTDLDKP